MSTMSREITANDESQPGSNNSPRETPPACIPTQIDIERMGRQRPDIFKTWWAEIGFCVAILGSMLSAVTQPYPPARTQLTSTGVLYQWLYHHPPDLEYGTRHTPRVTHLAG